MKTLIQILFLILITSAFTYSQWEKRSNGLPDIWTNPCCLSAVSKDIAAIRITTGNRLYITTNAGNKWDSIPFPQNVLGGIDVIEITDINHFWLGANEALPYVARIYATTDGGINWTLQYEDPDNSSFINYIEMFDENNGVAMCDPPFQSTDKPAVFLRTTNGGDNWISMNENQLIGYWSGDQWRRVDFVNLDVGYFRDSGGPQRINKTTDGGVTWSIKSPSVNNVVALNFFDENYGLAGNYYGTIFRTTDGGENWETINLNIGTESISGFSFLPEEPEKVWGVIFNYNKLIFSSDSGKTWTEQYVADNYNNAYDIYFVDNNCGWLIAPNDYLTPSDVYYNPDGTIVSSVWESISPLKFYLNQNYPNPFNPSTKISWQSPVGSWQTLKIYDVLGNEVATLVDEYRPAGSYEVEVNATGFSSGIYLYRLTVGSYTKVRKMVVLK